MLLDLNTLFPAAADGTHSALPKQKEFMDAVLDPQGPKYVAYYGGYGSGKSLILCIINIIQGVLYGGEYVIARNFSPELKRTTYKLFLDLLPKQLLLEHRVADAEVHIKSQAGKAIFYFVGLDDPQKLDSLTLSGASIDEASQVSEEAFLKLQGRIRSPKGLRKTLLVGNPKGSDYVHRYFIKQDGFKDISDRYGNPITAAEQRAQYKIFVAPSTENKHLPDGYIESMLATYSPERVQRDIYGSFDSFEGQVYNEFRRDIHVIKPFKIPAEWPRFIGADHGYRNPAAFLWGASDYDGNMYIYREFYETEWLVEEICQGKGQIPGIIGLSGVKTLKKSKAAGHTILKAVDGEKIDYIVIDPSTKAVRGQTGSSDWDIYCENLPTNWPLIPAKNEVHTGIDQVKSYLKLNLKTNKPQIYFFDTCRNLIDEITQYRWEEQSSNLTGKKNEKEAPRKYKDHAVDALRYLIMSRPENAKPEDLKKKKMGGYGVEASLYKELQQFKRGKKDDDPFKDF